MGAVLAATAKLFISPSEVETLSREQPFLAIPAMMLLAVLMCLCSEADAFVAASFTNMHLSAKVAFLVLGPMLDLKLLLMYTRVFRRRLIVTIAWWCLFSCSAWGFTSCIRRMAGRAEPTVASPAPRRPELEGHRSWPTRIHIPANHSGTTSPNNCSAS
jgi:hypothetical protein